VVQLEPLHMDVQQLIQVKIPPHLRWLQLVLHT
jgi:hypothetical protein